MSAKNKANMCKPDNPARLTTNHTAGCISRKNVITAAIHFDSTWMPRVSPDPCASVADLKSQSEQARRLDEEIAGKIKSQGSGILKLVEDFNAEFGAVTPAQSASANLPRWRWSWFGDFDMTAMAMGAQAPTWDARNCCFWPSRQKALSWVKSVSDVNRISIPKWSEEPAFQQMLESRQRWYKAFPDNPPGSLGGASWNQPAGREPVKFLSYMSFIDMGPHLFGADEFMMILAGDAQLADALMEKFFELSTSYSEFMQALQGGKVGCIVGFGGDYACMLSPDLYQKYSVAWDQKLFDYFRKFYAAPQDAPCNLHSCGPSSHLYSHWGTHPLRSNITTMQTRLLSEHVKSLRLNLPETLLQLTFHPEHFDFANVGPDDVRAVLRQAVEDVNGSNAEFVVFAFANDPQDIERLETNLHVMYDEMDEINSCCMSGIDAAHI